MIYVCMRSIFVRLIHQNKRLLFSEEYLQQGTLAGTRQADAFGDSTAVIDSYESFLKKT